ncbi:MAG: hypothetical protein IJO76_07235, partial [Clostridia bacterium]|nr:hypothetical protein [Clostridia bacterium]
SRLGSSFVFFVVVGKPTSYFRRRRIFFLLIAKALLYHQHCWWFPFTKKQALASASACFLAGLGGVVTTGFGCAVPLYFLTAAPPKSNGVSANRPT